MKSLSIGLGRLNFTSPDELAADDSLFTSRIARMGGSPAQVATYIFENLPDTDLKFFDQPD